MTKELITFIWDRLPLDKLPPVKVPCLAEDWFIEDLAAVQPFVWRGRGGDESLRLLYRYARQLAIERFFIDGCYRSQAHYLLLHQMVELVPALLDQVVVEETGSFASLQA